MKRSAGNNMYSKLPLDFSKCRKSTPTTSNVDEVIIENNGASSRICGPEHVPYTCAQITDL